MVPSSEGVEKGVEAHRRRYWRSQYGTAGAMRPDKNEGGAANYTLGLALARLA